MQNPVEITQQILLLAETLTGSAEPLETIGRINALLANGRLTLHQDEPSGQWHWTVQRVR